METIGGIANVATALALLVAVAFGILQLGHLAKTRAIFSSAELVHSFQTADFTRSVIAVSQLPDGADPETITRDPAVFAATQYVGHVFESLGVLVYHRIIPLHLVDDLLGGYVRLCWRKLGPQVTARRRDMGINYGEWMQWLAERLAEHPSPGKSEGAHLAHRTWIP
jgi:hypothetical protein